MTQYTNHGDTAKRIKKELKALAAADYPEYPEDGRGDSPDDAPGSFCHKPMTVARPAQSWKVW